MTKNEFVTACEAGGYASAKSAEMYAKRKNKKDFDVFDFIDIHQEREERSGANASLRNNKEVYGRTFTGKTLTKSGCP